MTTSGTPLVPRAEARWRSVLAVVLYVVGVASMGVTVASTWFAGGGSRDGAAWPIYITFFTYATVGLLILARQPGNRVGWLVGAVGFFPMLGGLAERYVERVPDWPLSDVARWYGTWYFFAAMWTLPLLFLLFPDGRPASRRWRWPVLVVGISVVAQLMRYMAGPGDCVDGACGSDDNPFQPAVLQPFMPLLDVIGAGGFVLGLLAGVASLALRFHRARGVERQQVKWFAGTVLLALLLFAVSTWIPAVWLSDAVGNGLFAVAVIMPAVGVAVAVLRYRLYDLDRLISRTLSYGLLTALLLGVYLALVAAATWLLPGGSSLAVAASTLAVAALFQRLRRRLQSLVDRRFNRARYDAARTLEDFSAWLRAEVDLDAVRTDLLAVVDQTLEPTHTSLWLRPGRDSS